MAPLSRALARPPLDRWTLGKTLGHAIHPALTDLPIGFWTSAVTLDVIGGPDARRSAQQLLGIGTLSALPTALTGVAEWDQIPRPESRVATAHAALNGVAMVLFAGSYVARRRGRYAVGVGLGLAASVPATAAGVLGGHLTGVRHVGIRDPAYNADDVGPQVQRPTS
ncbi:hypothetical protein VV02_04075 [Luteipulveratus mongoliensis]|uniref:DUF2231 domain-containing protein n=2 Tax=Luteipulveratus mongoliensis TaxID=571913 RepID=A0A0K1JPI1_9MICO|nr:hypothetical protein VV02_04075 [Luteipulveratus mongoliensis]